MRSEASKNVDPYNKLVSKIKVVKKIIKSRFVGVVPNSDSDPQNTNDAKLISMNFYWLF
jgi:hypothetical protein